MWTIILILTLLLAIIVLVTLAFAPAPLHVEHHVKHEGCLITQPISIWEEAAREARHA